MIYLFLKSAHVAAVLTFAGGLLLLAVVSAFWMKVGTVLLPHEQRIGNAVLRWDRRVTVPALLAAWGLGLGLVSLGGWSSAPWLWAKTVLVMVLSAMHGILAARLRRRIGGDAQGSIWLRRAPTAVVGLLCLIAVLVVMKP